mgnify:CR=1 FL=1
MKHRPIHIELTQGKKALISLSDRDKVNSRSWHVAIRKNRSRAETAINGRVVDLGRFILSAPKHLHVDHINGDALDNRRENIRLCTVSQNNANRFFKLGKSKYKGVSKHPLSKKWRATIGINWRNLHLGVFDKEIDAARTYDLAAKKYFGEFAKTNF